MDGPPRKTNKGTLELWEGSGSCRETLGVCFSLFLGALVATSGDDGQMMKGSFRRGLLTPR